MTERPKPVTKRRFVNCRSQNETTFNFAILAKPSSDETNVAEAKIAVAAMIASGRFNSTHF